MTISAVQMVSAASWAHFGVEKHTRAQASERASVCNSGCGKIQCHICFLLTKPSRSSFGTPVAGAKQTHRLLQHTIFYNISSSTVSVLFDIPRNQAARGEFHIILVEMPMIPQGIIITMMITTITITISISISITTIPIATPGPVAFAVGASPARSEISAFK
jgi:hypothetical protein